MIFVVGLFAYLAIGFILETFFSRDESDGTLLFLWPPVVILILAIGPLYLLNKGTRKMPNLIKKYKHRNDPPSPTAIVCGLVETIVLKHIDGWYRPHGGSSIMFKHKNIVIKPGSNNSRWNVMISDDALEVTDELQAAISKSMALWLEKEANRMKYEKEHRMLENLAEFMEAPPSQIVEA